MQVVIVRIVAKFNVEVAQVVEQEYVLALVAIRENVSRKIKSVELLVGRKAGKIGRLHTHTGLAGEVNKKRAAHQMSRPTLYTTTKTALEYN